VAPDLGLPKAVLNEMRKHAQETSGKLKKIHEDRMNEASDKVKKARERISPDNRIEIDLSQTEIPNSKLVAELKDISFGYSELLFSKFNLSIYGPERLSFSGPNGSGKTTLVKLMLGELKPLSGEITLGINRSAYLDQNVAVLDKAKTVLENLKSISNIDEGLARNWLAQFLFPADDVFKKVEVLSGGERMRAALACILAGDTPPKLLILDEPTNNLDLNSIEQIESALLNFEGALVVISHDKSFLKNIGIEREIDLRKQESSRTK
jgi:ATPase subunit of ABC transporter with duplicated ATPase domains